MYSAEYILKWYDRLLGVRRNFEPTWRNVCDYVLPNKTGIDYITPGTKRTQKIYDGTATRCVKLLCAFIQGGMTSGNTTWFKLKMRDGRLNRIKRVRVWLEDTGELMIQEFCNSNFHAESSELYIDEVGFGTGALFTDEAPIKVPGRFPGILFTAVPCGTYVIDEGADGNIEVFGRTLKLSPYALERTFGGDGKIPQEILDKAKERKDEQVEVVHFICPREGGKADKGSLARELPFGSYYVLSKEKLLIRESGFHEFPVMCPRWNRLAGEVYGRGPSHEVIPDVMTLNKAVQLSLKAFGKAIDPPLKALHDGIVGGEVRLDAGGITYVSQMDGLVPLEVGAKWDVVRFKTEDIRANIERGYLVDLIQLKDSPAMTAEEVRTRQEQLIRILGPTLGRQESEFLNPLIQRVFNMMYRANAIPEAPPEVMDAVRNNAGHIDIEYTGQLARMQRLGEVQAMERLMVFAQPIATVNPGILDVFDTDEMARAAGEILGAPERTIRDEKTVAKIREDRASAQADADQAEQDRLDAASAKDLKAATPEEEEPDEVQALRLIQGGKA